MADISETLAPNSDQLDNIDLRSTGPQIFTVTRVDVHPGAEQPVHIHFAEFDRPWKPGKNMRRVVAHCWGLETDGWIGKRVELFADERVKFGKDTPGGTRIKRLSHIDGPQAAALQKESGDDNLVLRAARQLQAMNGKGASITLTKTPSTTSYDAVGDTITYTIVATNTGGSTTGPVWSFTTVAPPPPPGSSGRTRASWRCSR